VTLLSGDGGIGKSLLAQQLLTACALGQDWLGLRTLPCPGFGLFCEDDADELRRRQEAICRAMFATPKELTGLTLCSRVGQENALMSFRGEEAEGVTTDLYAQIRNAVLASGSKLVVLDTAADVFLGNENVRPQVRSFLNKLRAIAMEAHGAVLLTSHPSVAGASSGTGLSGSTAWNNTVRSRLYLSKNPETGIRYLKTKKANYGPAEGELVLKWVNGVFSRWSAPPSWMTEDPILG